MSISVESVSETDYLLGLSMAAFASSHIGMSANRNLLISNIGGITDQLGLVGNNEWRLPSFWPGDRQGGQQVFSTADIAGRQIYRFGYTIVSFVTLGTALYFYLQSTGGTGECFEGIDPVYFTIAVAANTASLTSLANASPLGLVPGFQATPDSLALERNDSLKFQVQGLTRVTRHPLILPVVPWGIANALLLGGRDADWYLFGGLALYAVLGCVAQDLRVVRQEGSVGTVFELEGEQNDSLQDFYQSTSFLPFRAVLDGRQSLEDIVREVPWLATILSVPVGYIVETKMLQWLGCATGI
jgi:uncharacterized membrane protein